MNIIPYTFYWITLDNINDDKLCKESMLRQSKLFNQFKKYSIKNIKVSATHYKKLVINKNKKNRTFIKKHNTNIVHLKKILACSISHLFAIKKFYNDCLLNITVRNNKVSFKKNKCITDIGIICEDDLSFKYIRKWPHSIQHIIKNTPKKWDILKLSETLSKIDKNYFTNKNDNMYIKKNLWSTLCYVINRKCAKKLVNMYFKNNEIIINDNLINAEQLFNKQNLNVYTYKLPLFTYLNPKKYQSLIHNNHLPLHIRGYKIMNKIWKMYEKI